MFPALALFLAAFQAAPVPETRGVWIVRTALASPQSVDDIVDRAHEAGLNTIFVQVRGRGDAFYSSRLVARSPVLAGQPASFDPLARAIARADRYGMSVHAWVNVLLSANFGQGVPADNVVARHPEWLMVPRSAARRVLQLQGAPSLIAPVVRAAGAGKPDVEGYYLSPSASGVPEHLEAVVRELLDTYPVAGLHLDFIRYPNAEFDYSRAALEGFSGRHGDVSDSQLLAQALRAPDAFADYRRDALSRLASRLADAARAARPGVVVSAAVVPDPKVAVGEKFQAWPLWIDNGVLDALCPMIYTESASLYHRQVGAIRALVPPGRQLWAGIGAWRISAQDTVDRVWDARAAGASGVVVFSHEALLLPGAVASYRDGAFRDEAAPPAAAAASGGSRR